jgi:hypothetical protein
VMLVLLLAPVLGFGSGNAAAPVEESSAADLTPLAETEFAIEQVRYGLGEATLQVSTVGLPPGARIILRDAVARFEFEDETVFEVPARDRRRVIAEARNPFGGRFRVLGEEGPFASYGASIDIPLTEEQTRMLTQRRASVSIRASAEVSAPGVRAELPLDRGARHLGSGESIRIEEVGMTPDGPMVALRMRILEREGEGAPAGDGDRFRVRAEQPFALLNRTRGEALVLRPGSSGGGSGMGLVLFRPGLTEIRTELHASAPPRWEGSTPVVLDPEWLDRATLAVIEWVPVGTVPVAIHSRPLPEPLVR